MNRRNFLQGMFTACAAPAIVRASSLMPVKVPADLDVDDFWKEVEYDFSNSQAVAIPRNQLFAGEIGAWENLRFHSPCDEQWTEAERVILEAANSPPLVINRILPVDKQGWYLRQLRGW